MNEANSWLLAYWAKLAEGAKDAVDWASVQVDYGGAIYDQHEDRKRVMMLGAEYVLKEKTASHDSSR